MKHTGDQGGEYTNFCNWPTEKKLNTLMLARDMDTLYNNLNIYFVIRWQLKSESQNFDYGN